ncbi:hypothetical protein [uncultured Ilyobacter sp.]|uniref:hypothetical protein n=1 Tax=uncultured Ilyobacter sp. TaxID=544433 RepID=UPI0029C80CAA|nr:hypothetical protein [uncultured Ilyobacter sp.]
MMMKKRIALAAFIIACIHTFGQENLYGESVYQGISSDKILGATDEVEIDLGSETVKSEDGVNLQYGNLKMKVYELQRDKEKNTVTANGDVIIEFQEGGAQGKIETRDAVVSLDGDYARFYDSKGYLKVGVLTGAEAPSDRIYFGGETTEYRGGNLILSNAWFTTDPKITQSEDINDAGYHLGTKEIVIEPDKQVVFRDTDLYIGGKDVLPFTVPWYAVNIRSGSEVPLFPMWGSDDDYGWYTSWGFLYGDRDSKYRGGFAPKFADTMGVLIGRWENEYKTDNYGTAKLDVTDALVYKKESSEEDRWDVEYSHNYNGDKGYLNFSYRNVTENMVSELESIRDDNENDGYYDSSSSNYTEERPDGGDYMSFVSLDTKLEKLGEKKDTGIYGRVKLVEEKESYKEIVNDRLDDLDYDEEMDSDLFSEVGITKDNNNYKMSAYYEYLDDLDAGSTKGDLQSKAENFGFEMTDKNNKLTLKYDEKTGDEYRELRSWERDPNLDDIINLSGVYEDDVEYVPWTVSKYTKNDSQNLYIGLGEYDLLDTGLDYKINYSLNTVEKELDLIEDPYRSSTISTQVAGNSSRDTQYNRFEDVIYEDKKEDRVSTDLSGENLGLTFAAGRTEEEFLDREGIYDYGSYTEGDAYNKYVNESDYYEVGVEKRSFGLGYLGDFGVKYNMRHDQYNAGYNPNTQSYTSGGDETLRHQLTLNLKTDIYDNAGKPHRKADVDLGNEFTYFYQDYDYRDGDSGLGDAEDAAHIRLKNKDRIFQYKDIITMGIGNTETGYTVDYSNIYDASEESRKKRNLIKNSVDLKIDETKIAKIYYNFDEHFTDENESNENFNDLTNSRYGIDYSLGDHKVYYKKEKINYDIWDMKDTDDSRERITEDTYGYQLRNGLDKWQFEFIRGKDDRYNETEDTQDIDVDNQIYSLSYLNGGEVEHYYKTTYENYDHKEDANNLYSSDVVSFRYEYRDKRFTDEDLEKYGEKEFDKTKDELSQEDIEKIRNILEDRESNSLDFNLSKIRDEKMDLGEYKKKFSLYLMFQRNSSRYSETGNYWDSMEGMDASLYYSYNRLGVGYEFNQDAGYDSSDNWSETDRDHELSLSAKVGKPSEGWRVKTFVRLNESLSGDDSNRKTLDGIGVELGKEKGYYEWAVAMTREYVSSIDDYEWEVALQFTLLTFPNMPIFGFGAQNDGEKTSPQTYLFDGVNVENIE